MLKTIAKASNLSSFKRNSVIIWVEAALNQVLMNLSMRGYF